MQKLLVVIVPSRSGKKLRNAVIKEGVGMTILQSVGAFLGKRNATFLIACESKQVEKILKIIRETCKRNSVFVADSAVDAGSPVTDLPLGAPSTKLEVGGALVFVLDVEKSERI